MQEHLVVELQPHIKNSYQSFFRRYFNTNSLIVAIILSIPIYLEYFNFKLTFINTFFLILGFFLFFNSKHSFFQTGFFLGIFLFYWIGLSFRYYNLTWLIPFIILLIGIGYGLIFFILNKFFKIFKFSIFHFPFSTLLWILFLTFGFDYVRPFTFDWFKPEIFIVNTYFGLSKFAILSFFIGTYLLKDKKLIACLILSISILLYFYQKPHINMPKLKIKVVSTFVPQNKKWKKTYIPLEIKNNFKIINQAIKEKKDVVILPESAFPIFLNLYPDLMQRLINLSSKITIITGALHYKNKKFYNSTYVFENGNIKIIDKHILVPFGEYIPIPIFQKEINEIFFNGASDYKTAKNFGIFAIKSYKFINAICYEATIENLYKLKPKYIIALSNDAWFMPSIMPIIQKRLIKLYSYKYKKLVFHSINGYKSYIIIN